MNEAGTFQDLVLTHLDALYHYALLLTRESDEAEDLLQEGLLRAFEHFRAFDASRSFKAWMFTILKRAYIDRWRRQRTRLGYGGAVNGRAADWSSVGVHTAPLVPDDILMRRETVQQVRDAIQRLPSAFKEVVELRDVEGLSYEQIATRMRRPVGTVMSRLNRGRSLLRSYLLELRRPAAAEVRTRNGL
jgi:RNA polymerase sigma-70 factor (ECF subfamily)